MKLSLNNGKVFVQGKLIGASIAMENGKISEISSKKISTPKEMDCTGKIILPAAIDVHVHFRCPGLDYKEDWVSGSLAALHGGGATGMDMPKNNPPPTTAHAP